MSCGVSAADRDKIRDASDRFSADITQGLSARTAQVFTPEVIRKVNVRWENLVNELKADSLHNEHWQVYIVGHEIMMAKYHSVTEDLQIEMGSTDSYGLTGPLERIWVPVVLEICGVSVEQRDRFHDEYARSVT